MKWFAGALLVVLVLLQIRLWLSGNGERALPPLEAAVAAQRAQNAQLAQRNSQLAAEVHDLKSGTAALAEEARTDLGMIGPNETFFQVAPRPGTAVSATDAADSGAAGPARAPAAARQPVR